MKIFLSNMAELYCKSGIIRIEKILPNSICLNGNLIEDKITSNNYTDKIKFYHLSLKNGTIISIGENTLVHTLEGEKKIQDVKSNDYVLHKFAKINPIGSELVINWEVILGANCTPIKVPKKMNKDLALWLGIVSSKGRYYEDNGYVAISINDKIVGRLIHDLTIKLFKIKPKIYEDKNTGSIQHYIISRNLVRFLKSFLGVNNTLKKVPQQILEGSLEEQFSFIQGLTLDGYVDQGFFVVYGGISKRLADFTAIVLKNSGHCVYQQIRKTGQGNNIYYTKILFSSDISYPIFALEDIKTEGLTKGGFFVKVTDKILETKIPTSNPGYSAHRNLKQRGAKVCYNHTLDDLNIPYNKDEYFVMVKEIKTSNEVGFSVETETGSLIYNGIVLGNLK